MIPKEIIQLLKKKKIKLKKSLGQNYLIDKNYLKRISQEISFIKERNPQSLVLEVGCGLGSLTEYLLGFSSVVGIEIDLQNYFILKKRFSSRLVDNHLEFKKFKKKNGFLLFQEDIMDFDLNQVVTDQQKIIVVGNLPYHLVYKIIYFFLEKHFSKIMNMVFMMQKEVGERIRSQKGNKSYGIPSLLIGYYCWAKKIIQLPPQVFYPSPKVNSEVLLLTPNKREKNIDYQFFKDLVKICFHNRRKSILNSIKHSPQIGDEKFCLEKISQCLLEIGFNLKSRAEELGLEDYIKLTQLLIKDEK